MDKAPKPASNPIEDFIRMGIAVELLPYLATSKSRHSILQAKSLTPHFLADYTMSVNLARWMGPKNTALVFATSYACAYNPLGRIDFDPNDSIRLSCSTYRFDSNFNFH